MNCRASTLAVSDPQQDRPWHPVLSGTLKRRARDTVSAIAADLEGYTHEGLPNPWLSAGYAGVALFFAHLAGARDDRNAAAIANRCLVKATRGLAGTAHSPALFEGLAGVAWALEHIGGQLYGDEGRDRGPGRLEAQLSAGLGRRPRRADFDLVTGLVGQGVYFLCHNRRPWVAPYLGAVLDGLEDLAEHPAAGITWRTPQRALNPQWQCDCPHGHYNLGLAHGVPGVIAWLAHLATEEALSGALRERARGLLAPAVRWLLDQRERVTSADRHFPYYALPDSAGDARTALPRARCAWCYGDPGIALALHLAARATRCADWEDAAVAIGEASAQHRQADGEVVDAGLCHGSAGLGHVFARLYNMTRIPLYAARSRYWFEVCLRMHQPGTGVAGYRAWEFDQTLTGDWRDQPGLLTGAAGIGLALLAASEASEPSWDAFMLLSSSGRRL